MNNKKNCRKLTAIAVMIILLLTTWMPVCSLAEIPPLPAFYSGIVVDESGSLVSCGKIKAYIEGALSGERELQDGNFAYITCNAGNLNHNGKPVTFKIEVNGIEYPASCTPSIIWYSGDIQEDLVVRASTPPFVHIAGVSVSPTSLNLTVGGEVGNLSAAISPANATNQSLFWQSGNPAVASVSNGVVTPIAPGNTMITVTAMDGGLSAVANVIVSSAGTKSLYITSASRVVVGEWINLSATSHGYTDGVYQFWYRSPDGRWRQSGHYEDNRLYSFKAEQIGIYQAVVYAKERTDPAAEPFAIKAVTTIDCRAVGPAAADLRLSTASLPGGTVNQAYGPFGLTAEGGTPPYHGWGATLPAGLAIDPGSGLISGIPAAAGSYSVTAWVYDQTSYTQRQMPLTFSAAQLTIKGTGVPTACVNLPYRAQFEAAGGVPPYRWEKRNGADWAEIDQNGSLTGVPTVAGDYPLELSVWDAVYQHATRNWTISVLAGQPLQIKTNTLPTGVVNKQYGPIQLEAAGGSPPYHGWGAALPAGLSINPGSGVIGGIPLAAGNYTVSSWVYDQAGRTDREFELWIYDDQLAISGTSVPYGTAGQAYAAQFKAVGGVPPYRWQKSQGAAWAVIDQSGRLTGTPPAAGNYPCTLSVWDAVYRETSSEWTISVLDGDAFSITSQSLPAGVMNQPYGPIPLAAAGGTPPYYGWGATLPAGLAIDSGSGVISGSPRAAGSYTVTGWVYDQTARTERNFTLWIYDHQVAITGIEVPDGAPGAAYAARFKAVGGVPPYRWEKVAGASWLTMDQQGRLTGVPLLSGDYPVKLSVWDAVYQNAVSEWTVHIRDQLTLTVPPLIEGRPGEALTVNCLVNGGTAPYQWSILEGPAWAAVNNLGTVMGVPPSPGDFSIWLTVSDAMGLRGSARLSFRVRTEMGPEQLQITTSGLAASQVGMPYSCDLHVVGGSPPYHWQAENLPDWLSLTPEGRLTGTPAAAGQYHVGLTVADSASVPQQSRTSLLLQVDPAEKAPEIAVAPLTISESAANDGSLAEPLTVSLTDGDFSENAGGLVTISGLPPGLSYAAARISSKQLIINFSGNARQHANSNDIGGLRLTVHKAGAVGAAADLASNPFGIDFRDPVSEPVGSGRITAQAADARITLASGNTRIATTDQTWVVKLNVGTVKAGVGSSNLILSGLPSGIQVTAAKGTSNSIVITASGSLAQPLTQPAVIGVVVKANAVTQKNLLDSEPVTVYLNPAG